MRGDCRVSIGLPVYNGENYVAEAIESLLAQTYSDFELVICDNASSDRTPQICQDYAAKDKRIRYHHNERNVGITSNFNLTFERSSGRYFKWVAHDDVHHPEFLARCLDALEKEPDAVLAFSKAEAFDSSGRTLAIHDAGLLGTDRPSRSARFGARLRAPYCHEMFGLIRRDALEQTRLMRPAADRALLAELALLGRFITVPEVLFRLRCHQSRSSKTGVLPQARIAKFEPDAGAQRRYPTWALYSDYVELIRRYSSSSRERFMCYLQLVRSLGARWNWLRLALEPIIVIEPRVFRLADALRRVVGSSPTD